MGKTAWTTIKVSKETLDVINQLKHPGQSANGFVQELIHQYRAANPSLDSVGQHPGRRQDAPA